MKGLLLGLALLAAAAVDDATSAQWAAQYDTLADLQKKADSAAKNHQPEVALALSAQLGPLADAYLAQLAQAQKMGVFKDSFRIKTQDGVLSGAQLAASFRKFKSGAAARQASTQSAAKQAEATKTAQISAQIAAKQRAAEQPTDPARSRALTPEAFEKQLQQDMIAINEAAKRSTSHIRGPNPYYMPAMRELLRCHKVAQDHIAAQKRADRFGPKRMFTRADGTKDTYEKIEKGLLSGQRHAQESYDSARKIPAYSHEPPF